MFSCFLSLNVKSFSLNESNINLVLLRTSLYTRNMSLSLSSFFLLLRTCKRDLVGILLYWNCSMNRMLWDRRDVIESLHYPSLRLFIFLGRDKYLVWLSDIVICLLSLLVSLTLSLLIFLSPFNRWFVSWNRSSSIIHSLVLYLYFHFLTTSL